MAEEVAAEVFAGELEELFRPVEALEPVFAERAQAESPGKVVSHELAGHAGDEHLGGMGGRLDACHPVERAAEVVVPAALRRAGVDADPHGQRADVLPRLRGEPPLHVAGGRQCGVRLGEGHAEGVADGLENVAAVAGKNLPQQLVMAPDCGTHGRGMLFPEPRAADDVGEDEGHGSLRRVHARE